MPATPNSTVYLCRLRDIKTSQVILYVFSSQDKLNTFIQQTQTNSSMLPTTISGNIAYDSFSLIIDSGIGQ